jgi:hypothetical protein
LEAKHGGEALDNPEVEQSARLAGVCSAVDVGNQEAMRDKCEEDEENDWGSDKREKKRQCRSKENGDDARGSSKCRAILTRVYGSEALTGCG